MCFPRCFLIGKQQNCSLLGHIFHFPGGSDGKESACNVGDLGSIPGQEEPLEKGMATHSSILAWRIPWTEEPGRLLSMGSHRVRHDWSDLACMHAWEGYSNPLQYSCLENPRDRGAEWAAVYGVAESQTRLKWLSSSNNIMENNMKIPQEIKNRTTIRYIYITSGYV